GYRRRRRAEIHGDRLGDPCLGSRRDKSQCDSSAEHGRDEQSELHWSTSWLVSRCSVVDDDPSLNAVTRQATLISGWSVAIVKRSSAITSATVTEQREPSGDSSYSNPA